MNKNTYFTSEAVSPGHPDKVADIISDAVLAYYLTVAPEARVACETFVVGKKVILGGEVNVSKITPLTPKDYKTIIADCLKSIGYTPEVYPEFNYENFDLEVLIQNQSSEINNAVDKVTDIAAGDQGIMFGWATNNKETNYLGTEHYYALKLMKVLNTEVKSNKHNVLRPDAKSQITGKYNEKGELVSFDTILVSHQHKPDYFDDAFEVIESTIRSVIPEKLIDSNTKIIINPSGAFTIGGPIGDTGLTGRKIIVDTYGGKAKHGGGAFSGKDYSKVDRSAAYGARYIAKNLVAAGYGDEVEVQLSYGIGMVSPISIKITGIHEKYSSLDIDKIVRRLFPTTPSEFKAKFELQNGKVIIRTPYNGHFTDESLPWEELDKVNDLEFLLEIFNSNSITSLINTSKIFGISLGDLSGEITECECGCCK